ncbi:unnamed protein product [Soboliphyme baturini]|uniref:Acyl-peptide hydrolase n=1 Tax=Soboliphyme baturini TaxID=241478 RepID=A0A183IDB7_9BILA|nr:unnamed protein product [Soboliphyme baturini]
MLAARKRAPFGSWQSTITSSLITDSSVVLLELHLDQQNDYKDTVYWSEYHSDLEQSIIFSKKQNDHIMRWTPPRFSVDSKVHEYGGGSFFVCERHVYFCNAFDQRIYRQGGPLSAPFPITHPCDSRFADGYVFKSTAADFYASPKISPDGKLIVWMQWNLPNMPWDSTEIWMADLDSDANICSCTSRKIAGGDDVNFMQPKFSLEQSVFCISDRGGFWNLYQCFGSGHWENVYEMDMEGGYPQWNFAADTYSFDPRVRLPFFSIATVFDEHLYIIDSERKTCELQPTTYSHHQYICFGLNKSIYCLASDALRFPAIIRWDVVGQTVEIIRESRPALDSSLISVPKALTFSTGVLPTEKVYVNFYAPLNPLYEGEAGTLPPLVVMPHSGPTSRTCNCLNLKVQYYTSRGFAVATVDYRGSTGYGKAFRDALKKNYGVYDYLDCCSAALSLVELHLVNPEKLCITGRSSGGYVVLCALVTNKVFHAGACHFGICDLIALQEETHKFESGYNDLLIGPFEDSGKTYSIRSPCSYINEMKTPVAFFHGADDKVVPPGQIIKFFESLKKNKVPCSLTIFEKEGHGYRIPANIRFSADGEYFFFCTILGIKPFVPENFSIVWPVRT